MIALLGDVPTFSKSLLGSHVPIAMISPRRYQYYHFNKVCWCLPVGTTIILSYDSLKNRLCEPGDWNKTRSSCTSCWDGRISRCISDVVSFICICGISQFRNIIDERLLGGYKALVALLIFYGRWPVAIVLSWLLGSCQSLLYPSPPPPYSSFQPPTNSVMWTLWFASRIQFHNLIGLMPETHYSCHSCWHTTSRSFYWKSWKSWAAAPSHTFAAFFCVMSRGCWVGSSIMLRTSMPTCV